MSREEKKMQEYKQGRFVIPELDGEAPDSVHQSVLAALDEISAGKPKKVRRLRTRLMLPFAAALALMAGMSVFAVSLYEQRMQSLNQEKLEEYYVQIYSAEAESFRYNRNMTVEERQRYDALWTAYEEEGVFPQNVLTLLDEPEDYKGRGIGLYAKRGTLFLPEGELTDEEMLQIIDFYHQVDYSLQKVQGQIAEGEIADPMPDKGQEQNVDTTDLSTLDEVDLQNAGQELTIAYEGDLSISVLGVGKRYIYLGGWESIERMEIGSSVSEPFFSDYAAAAGNTDLYPRVVDLVEGEDGSVYAAVLLMDSLGDGMQGKGTQIWHISADGELINTIGTDKQDITKFMVDGDGNIYVRPMWWESETILYVYDAEGNFVKEITSDHGYHVSNGFCRGRDGETYMLATDVERVGETLHVERGIVRIDLEAGRTETVAWDILPQEGAAYEVIAPGIDHDFIIWGCEGIFTYNLGDEAAEQVLAPYEAPCEFEGCIGGVLPDGRVLLVRAYDSIKLEKDGKTQYRRNPESTYFYYISTK